MTDKTINLSLTPLDTVVVCNEIEEIIEGFEQTSRLRPLTGYEDLQHRSLEKFLHLVTLEDHKINLEEIKQEVTDKVKQYDFEQRTDPTKNN